jgi:hypothetical protein
MERGKFEITVPKLISLATIYSRPPEELLRQCLPGPPTGSNREQLMGPNSTVLVNGGALEEEARHLLPDSITSNSIPEDTMLLPLDERTVSTPIRRAIVGRRDRALSPMIRPGSVLKIDTLRRAIAAPGEWGNEFDRPIYLLRTHEGLVSGWCDLDREGQWLTLVTHNLSRVSSRRWRYRKEVEVMGRAIAVAMRLIPLPDTPDGRGNAK